MIPTDQQIWPPVIEDKQRLRSGRGGPFRGESIRGQRFACLSLPVLLRSDRAAGTVGGDPHGGEIAFVFGTLGIGGFGPPPPPPTPQDQAVSQMAQSYWVNFAKTGDPNGAGLPTWPRYDPRKDLIFDFHPDGSASAVPDPWKARLDVMQLTTEARRFLRPNSAG
jgi:carboxylesterase type B